MVIRYLFVVRKSSNARYRSQAGILHIGQLETRPRCDAASGSVFSVIPRSYRFSRDRILTVRMLAMLRHLSSDEISKSYLSIRTTSLNSHQKRNRLFANVSVAQTNQ